MLSELGAITLATLLGFVALLNAAVAPRVLVALCAFVWVLFGSTGSTAPLIASLPAGNSVTYGPYVSALGFLLVIAAPAARRSTGARVSTDTPPPPGGRQGWGHGWGAEWSA